MFVRSLAIAAGLSLLAGSAFAADLTIPSDEAPVVDNTFSWDGLYVGVAAAGEFELNDGDDSYFGGGVFVGANFLVAESFLIGIEGSFDALTDGDISFGEAFVWGRAGVLVTPEVLLYGVAGVGVEFELEDNADSTSAYQLGGGVEFAVADNISIRGQLTGYGYFDGDDLFDYAHASVGVAFHF